LLENRYIFSCKFWNLRLILSNVIILLKYVGLIKYKTLKPAAIAQRAPQVLDLVFNYADVLITLFHD